MLSTMILIIGLIIYTMLILFAGVFVGWIMRENTALKNELYYMQEEDIIEDFRDRLIDNYEE